MIRLFLLTDAGAAVGELELHRWKLTKMAIWVSLDKIAEGHLLVLQGQFGHIGSGGDQPANDFSYNHTTRGPSSGFTY